MSSSFLLCLLLSSFYVVSSSESPKNGGFTVDLIHRDSPRLISGNPSTTHFSRMRSAFDRSFSRKSSLLSSLSNSLKDSVDAPITPAGGEYVLKLQIGTPPVEILGIADTGSDLTWTQCKPCTQCYEQNLPLFDPSKSSSYRPISCESVVCQAAGTASCDADNRCEYQVSYGDRSYTIGDVAAETLTFDGGVSFPKVAFGCGHQNAGTFSQTGSGIVGLGGGAVSIINQLQSTIGGKFSYCLTLLNSNISSKISFGSAAVVGGDNVVSTPLVKKSTDTFYYLTLEGISVGEERVDSAAAAAAEYEGNIIIDSGTTLTFVPQEIYEGVEAALVKAITAERVSDPQGTFGLCYGVGSSGKLEGPALTAHFKGADVVVAAESVFVEVEEGIACLTVVASQDLAIFGNLHQMNYRIGYDLVKGEVSFQQTDCTKAKAE